MKTSKLIMIASVLLLGLTSFSACKKHNHEFKSEYSKDALGHWQEAICEHTNVKNNYGIHEYGNFVVTKNPTDKENGIKKQECSVCGYVNVVFIPALGHQFGNPTWVWDGYNGAVAKFVCSNNASHEEIIKSTISSEITTDATCTTNGEKTYTAKVTYGGKTYSDTKKETLPSLGHSFTNYVSNNDATSTKDGTKTAHCDHEGCNETNTINDNGTMLGHTYGSPIWTWNEYSSARATFTCQTCDAQLNHTESVDARIDEQVTLAATCSTTGLKKYTATVVFGGVTYTDSKDAVLPKTDHSFTNYVSNNDVSCTHEGNLISKRTIGGESNDSTSIYSKK